MTYPYVMTNIYPNERAEFERAWERARTAIDEQGADSQSYCAIIIAVPKPVVMGVIDALKVTMDAP